MKSSPEDIAKYLFEEGLSIEDYTDLQNRRRERLDLWLDRRIKIIADKEMELINQGDLILDELKKLKNSL